MTPNPEQLLALAEKWEAQAAREKARRCWVTASQARQCAAELRALASPGGGVVGRERHPNDPSDQSLAAAFHEYGEGITEDGPVVRAMQNIMFNARQLDERTAALERGDGE